MLEDETYPSEPNWGTYRTVFPGFAVCPGRDETVMIVRRRANQDRGRHDTHPYRR